MGKICTALVQNIVMEYNYDLKIIVMILNVLYIKCGEYCYRILLYSESRICLKKVLEFVRI